MRLWGKVVRVMLLVMAAVFAVVAIVMPEARREAFGAVILLIVVALLGVPVVLRFFMSFTGDEEILPTASRAPPPSHRLSRPAGATTVTIPSSTLASVSRRAAQSYPVEVKQAVDPELLDRLAPGVIVAVRVDRENHKKVVIDWREPIRATTHDLAGGESVEQQATATRSIIASVREKNSLWPFLRWGFLIFGLIFFRLSCEEDYYEKGGARVQGIVLQKTHLQTPALPEGVVARLPSTT